MHNIRRSNAIKIHTSEKKPTVNSLAKEVSGLHGLVTQLAEGQAAFQESIRVALAGGAGVVAQPAGKGAGKNAKAGPAPSQQQSASAPSCAVWG